MFLKIVGLISLLFLIQCNRGKVEFEQCGCVDGGNRRQVLVEARVSDDQIAEFMGAVVDFERDSGGNYDQLRIDGFCTEKEKSRVRVVFCAQDRRDYQILEETFQDVSFRETPIN